MKLPGGAILPWKLSVKIIWKWKNILTTMGGQKQEVKSLEAGDIPYVEVTKKRPKVYSLASNQNLRGNGHCKNEGQKGNSRLVYFFFFFFFFQNYLRDTGIDFELLCSPAHTQTGFKKKKTGLNDFMLIRRQRGNFFICQGNFRNQGCAIRSRECKNVSR